MFCLSLIRRRHRGGFPTFRILSLGCVCMSADMVATIRYQAKHHHSLGILSPHTHSSDSDTVNQSTIAAAAVPAAKEEEYSFLPSPFFFSVFLGDTERRLVGGSGSLAFGWRALLVGCLVVGCLMQWNPLAIAWPLAASSAGKSVAVLVLAVLSSFASCATKQIILIIMTAVIVV